MLMSQGHIHCQRHMQTHLYRTCNNSIKIPSRTLPLSLSRPHSAEIPVVIVCRDAQTKRGEERHTKNTRICRSVTLSTSCWVLYYITANTILLRNLSFFLVFANASCVCVCLVHNNSRIRYHSQIYYPLVYVLVPVQNIHKCFYNRNF